MNTEGKTTEENIHGADNRFFRLSPLYLPPDWHIAGWFSRVRGERPLGPCSTLERIQRHTEQYVKSQVAAGMGTGASSRSDFVGPVDRRAVRRG